MIFRIRSARTAPGTPHQLACAALVLLSIQTTMASNPTEFDITVALTQAWRTDVACMADIMRKLS